MPTARPSRVRRPGPIVAVGLALAVAAAAALLVRARPRAADDAAPADAADGAGPAPAGAGTLVGAGRPPPPAPARRRVTVVLEGSFGAPTTLVGFPRSDGRAIAADRGAFRREGARAVCDDPGLGPVTRDPPTVLVVPADGAPLRLALPVPRDDGGGWAASFDVTVVATPTDVAVLEGRVLEADGGPAADRTVVARTDEGVRVAPTADTDATGGYRLRLDPRAPPVVRVAVDAGDGAGDGEAVRPVPGGTVLVPDLRVGWPVAVAGRVLGDDATPAARVLLARPLAPPDRRPGDPFRDDPTVFGEVTGDGRFVVRALPPGAVGLQLVPDVRPWTAVHPDVTWSLFTLATSPATDVVLGRDARTLTFVAEDDAGRVETFVATVRGRRGELVVLGAPGEDADTLLPADGPLEVTVTAADHAPLRTTLDPRTAPDPVRFTLLPAPGTPATPAPRPGPTAPVVWVYSLHLVGLRATAEAAGAPLVTVAGTGRGFARYHGWVPPDGGAVQLPDPGRPLVATFTCPPFPPAAVELVPRTGADGNIDFTTVVLGGR